MSEASQDQSIDTVCFCENAQRSGVIADLARINRRDGQVGFAEGHDEWNLVSSGGLDNDPDDRPISQMLDETCNAVVIIGESIGEGEREVGQVKGLRGDIDAEETFSVGRREIRMLHGGRPILVNAGFDGPSDCSG